jgi:hypothetical protein
MLGMKAGYSGHHRIEAPIAQNFGDISLADFHHPLTGPTCHPLLYIYRPIDFAHTPPLGMQSFWPSERESTQRRDGSMNLRLNIRQTG